MEKRFRDYLRHLEKLDFDVISEEEIWEEREGLELKLTEIHQEMMRILGRAALKPMALLTK